jgi:restriction system protein
MSNKRKGSAADAVMELVAMLPWWVGVAMAVASYFFLTAVAAKPVVISGQGATLGTQVVASLWQNMAAIGRWLLPLVCLLGAGLSLYRRRQSQRLIDGVAQAPVSDVLEGMRWQEFEALVAEAFRLQGYQVQETGGGGADGGVDLVLTKPKANGSEKFLVQCKQWRAQKVGVGVVRELYGVMAARGAAGGFVVCSGGYTAEAEDFARGRNVNLVGGERLTKMIQTARAANKRKSPTETKDEPAARSETPSCPVCREPMTLRTAKRGANTGSNFWGCGNYPSCRGTRMIT